MVNKIVFTIKLSYLQNHIIILCGITWLTVPNTFVITSTNRHTFLASVMKGKMVNFVVICGNIN